MSAIAASLAPAPAEHNKPPLKDRLALDYEELISAIEAVAAEANALPKEIADDDDNAKASDVVKRVSARLKDAESFRVAEKEPFLQGGREVDGFFKELTDRLTRMKNGLSARLTAYMQAKAAAERRRLEVEAAAARAEADRKLAEAAAAEIANKPVTSAMALEGAQQQERNAWDAEARAAQAKPAELARTRSAEGTVATLQERWTFEITDLDAVNLNALREYIPLPDIEKAVRRFVGVHKATRKLDGIRIYREESAVVR